MAENKEQKNFSLTPANIRWLKERALALSTPEKRISDSLFLDNLIAAKRAEQERAKRILKNLTPVGEGSEGKRKMN